MPILPIELSGFCGVFSGRVCKCDVQRWNMNQKWKDYAAQIFASNVVLHGKRAFFAVRHRFFGRAHCITAYLKINDPYSHLLVQTIPKLSRMYDVEFKLAAVCYYDSRHYADLSDWHRAAQEDCFILAKRYNLQFPRYLPTFEAQQNDYYISALIKHADDLHTDWKQVNRLFSDYRRGKSCYRRVTSTAGERDRAQSQWHRRGYHLSALLEYDGETYYALRDIYQLERRLNELHLRREKPIIRQQQLSK